MRLTEKYNSENYAYGIPMEEHVLHINFDNFCYGNVIEKLGQYEDIDEDPKHLSKTKQALEVILKKDFIDLKLLKQCKSHYEYNVRVARRYNNRGLDIGLLTQEEFELLKEKLL